jgi:adenylate cyclase
MLTTTDWILIGVILVVCTYSVVVTAVLVKYRRHRLNRLAYRQHTRAKSKADKVTDSTSQQVADEALKLSQTFQKFVPQQFIDHITKSGSDHIELGYADEEDVAILFCDIRGFTGLSERMRPQELMGFLNSYFQRMNKPIHENRGFIDKFIGDAMMALFDHPGGNAEDKAIDAINAAMDLRKALELYNIRRIRKGYVPINVGVGIHYGPVVMGTVGSDDRMDTTVIGDSVNIACRLESLAPKYGADIIVSAQVLEAMGDKFPIRTRLLDWVRVKGREAPIEIYEVISHLPHKEQEKRFSVQPKIAAGLACRINKEWETAIAHFEAALAIFPQDSLAKHHIDVCRIYQSMLLPVDWDGALTIQ